MDPVIAQIAQDHRLAARHHLAFQVEIAVQRLGLMSYFVDHAGNGPFIQSVIANK